MWEEIDSKDWKNVPFISGRAATEQDVEEGRAVFYIPSGSEPYETGLPLFAVQTDSENNSRVPCVAIQIENCSEGTAVGVRYFSGGNGVGMANEFEFYNEITEEFSL
ncbi:hypothetical protein ACU6U9_17275 [Pseudomonas sp. HK3]